jgi:hypothetical protein
MTAPAAKPPVIYRLRLRSLADPDHDADDVRELRQLLKVLLRRFRFRCIELEREPAS